MKDKNEKGVWRTIGGRKIFIKDKQSLKDAVKESGKPPPESGERRIARVQAEYRASTNKRLAGYIHDVRAGTETRPFKLAGISEREAADIKEKTGVDVTGFTRILPPDSVRHIDKRHGEKGEADKSMADIADIARMEYVLQNYDEIEPIGKTSGNYRNKDGTLAQAVQYKKRINGNYYIAEAVPDAKRKSLIVVSAFKGKK